MAFIAQRPDETDFAFALRRLRITAIATAAMLLCGIAWWSAFPTVLITDHGPFVWFVSVLISFLLLIFAVVLPLVTAMSLVLFLWYVLERRYPRLSSPRMTVVTSIETALLMVAFGYASFELYMAVAFRVVDNIARAGFRHRKVALEDDPMFFWIYVSMYAVLWIGFAVWLMSKAQRLKLAR